MDKAFIKVDASDVYDEIARAKKWLNLNEDDKDHIERMEKIAKEFHGKKLYSIKELQDLYEKVAYEISDFSCRVYSDAKILRIEE